MRRAEFHLFTNAALLRLEWRTGQACAVGLKDVRFIDEAAERLLRTLSKQDTQFANRSQHVKYLLKPLQPGAKGGLLKAISCLSAVPLREVISPPSIEVSPEGAMTNGIQGSIVDRNSTNAGPGKASVSFF
jgi:hypothetical protein